MKTTISNIGFFLLFSFLGKAQHFYPQITQSLLPLGLVDPNSGGLHFQTEVRLTKKFGVALQYGTNFRIDWGDNQKNSQLSKTGIDLRIYSPLGYQNDEIYFGLYANNVSKSYRKIDDSFNTIEEEFSTSTTNFLQADVVRNVISIGLKSGFRLVSKRGTVFDLYGGLGLRRKRVDYRNIIFDPVQLPGFGFGSNLDLFDTDRAEGRRNGIDVKLGIAIGFPIFKKMMLSNQ